MRCLPYGPANQCLCGAPALHGNRRCAKCRARWRYHRRKARHDGV